MRKVKLFESLSIEDLEQKLNDFFEKHKNYIDVQYQITQGNNTSSVRYTCIIVYLEE